MLDAEEAIVGTMFDLQREVYESPQRRKALLCGRRAGKTDLLARTALATACRYPGELSLLASRTASQCIENYEPSLRWLVEQLDLPFNRVLERGQVFWRHVNGHKIWLAGFYDQPAIDRKRGYKFRLAGIDEANTFEREKLRYLIEDVLSPALTDTQGQLIVAAEPSAGVITLRGQWSVFGWDATRNPHHQSFRKAA